jgi:hypothetical protein
MKITWYLLRSPKNSIDRGGETQWKIEKKGITYDGFLEKIIADNKSVWAIQYQDDTGAHFQIAQIGKFDYEMEQQQKTIRDASLYQKLLECFPDFITKNNHKT